MLPVILWVILVLLLFVLWLILTQRKLVVLDENINRAMTQIGVQLAGRFDVLVRLLETVDVWDKSLSKQLIEEVRAGRKVISANSTPIQVQNQEQLIERILDKIVESLNECPQMKEQEVIIRLEAAVATFDSMVCSSILLYDDSVTRLNLKIRKLPLSLLAGMMGIHRRKYWNGEESESGG